MRRKAISAAKRKLAVKLSRSRRNKRRLQSNVSGWMEQLGLRITGFPMKTGSGNAHTAALGIDYG